jgi:integrase
VPKLKYKNPKLSQDGKRAVVYHDGTCTYLGKAKSAEALQNYNRFIAERNLSPSTTFSLIPKKSGVLLAELASDFLFNRKTRLDTSQYSHHKTAISFVLELYADIPADEFSPRKLKTVQNEMVRSQRFCRSTINDYVRRIREMFCFGVSEELVTVETNTALKSVELLKYGQTDAKESKSRKPVTDAVIDATLPFLSPILQSIVRLQRLVGARPSEILTMKVGEIDLSRPDGFWIYQPVKHKTQWKGKSRIIVFGKFEQEIIRPYLKGKKPSDIVFSPQEAVQEKKERDAANRKSPVQPSQVKRHEERMKNPKLKIGKNYTKDSYNRAIHRAIDKANAELPNEQQIPYWTPYQLRHTATTETVLAEGIEAAQKQAGHSSAAVTRIYDHSDTEYLVRLAKNRDRKKTAARENIQADAEESAESA